MILKLKDADGTTYEWTLSRDTRTPASWVLTDHTGYERHAGATYLLAVPFVRIVAENHGFTFVHDFN
jgi:hypothetical protein